MKTLKILIIMFMVSTVCVTAQTNKQKKDTVDVVANNILKKDFTKSCKDTEKSIVKAAHHTTQTIKRMKDESKNFWFKVDKD